MQIPLLLLLTLTKFIIPVCQIGNDNIIIQHKDKLFETSDLNEYNLRMLLRHGYNNNCYHQQIKNTINCFDKISPNIKNIRDLKFIEKQFILIDNGHIDYE